MPISTLVPGFSPSPFGFTSSDRISEYAIRHAGTGMRVRGLNTKTSPSCPSTVPSTCVPPARVELDPRARPKGGGQGEPVTRHVLRVHRHGETQEQHQGRQPATCPPLHGDSSLSEIRAHADQQRHLANTVLQEGQPGFGADEHRARDVGLEAAADKGTRQHPRAAFVAPRHRL